MEDKFTEVESRLRESASGFDSLKKKNGKLNDSLQSRFKKVEMDFDRYAARLSEFEKDTKEALNKLEENLITFNKVSIQKIEQRVMVEAEE